MDESNSMKGIEINYSVEILMWEYLGFLPLPPLSLYDALDGDMSKLALSRQDYYIVYKLQQNGLEKSSII